MADKAILFDSSRCSACQAYVAACKGMDEETLFESEAFAALKDALVAYALPTAARCGRRPASAACTAPRRLARKCAPPGRWR